MADQDESRTPSRRSSDQGEDTGEIVERQRQRVLDLLMRKVEEDHYPSTTMLDMIEDLMTPEDLDDYRELLSAKIEQDFYPSIPMLSRLASLG